MEPGRLILAYAVASACVLKVYESGDVLEQVIQQGLMCKTCARHVVQEILFSVGSAPFPHMPALIAMQPFVVSRGNSGA